MEKYFVITRPLQPRMTKRTTLIVLAAIWVVSMLLVIPTAFYSETQRFIVSQNLYGAVYATQCLESLWNSSRGIRAYTLTMFLLEFILPLLIMSVAYSLIAWRLWFRVVPGGYVTEEQERAAEKSKRRTVRMLILVVALFAICWAPYYGVALVRDFYYASLPEEYYSIYLTAFYLAEALAMSNSMFDTLIYVIFNANFRKCVLQLSVSRALPGNPYAQSVRQARSSNRRTGGTRNTVRSSPEPAAVNSIRSPPGSTHNYVTVEKENADEHELKLLVNGNCNDKDGNYNEIVSSAKEEEEPVAHV
ncbi:prokineticin receptor 2-like [Amphiura filiformis]|uniref:prokineticin receptor 2-like n=1 Tax=Amphiura filiformis TaxID=82378 RepID=UPI003B21B3E5